MTSRIAEEAASRQGRRKALVRTSFSRDLLEGLEADARAATTLKWPSDRYAKDPVRFCREILGIEPWEKQREILEAVRDHRIVAVPSGQKTGKSASAAMLAWWFYCSFPDARVIFTSTTSKQVDGILWRELRKIKAKAGKCVACKKKDPEDRYIPRPCPHSALIDGETHELARSGHKAPDFREIVGFTASEAEAIAGTSGTNLLYIPDEATGIKDAIFEAILGNCAGGGRVAMFSNPTRSEGYFADVCLNKAHMHKVIWINSEENPNAVSGKRLIPGLAERSYIEEKRQEYGADSAWYKVRVLGQFVTREEGKIISLADVLEAERRHSDVSADGLLCLAIDPAGEGGLGDESVFVARRGQKMLGMWAHRGVSDEGHLALALRYLESLRSDRERCRVIIDREGAIGSNLYGFLRGSSELAAMADLWGVRASDGAIRDPRNYGRVRDELWASLAQWIREGGAIIEDGRLAKELTATEWTTDIRGRLKATPKDEIRKAIGRSPDRADALALAVWETARFDDLQQEDNSRAVEPVSSYDAPMNAYEGLDVWR